MSDLRDGNILLPGPKCFVKMLSYSNLSYKEITGKISLTVEATNSIPVFVVKMTPSCNWSAREQSRE